MVVFLEKPSMNTVTSGDVGGQGHQEYLQIGRKEPDPHS